MGQHAPLMCVARGVATACGHTYALRIAHTSACARVGMQFAAYRGNINSK